MQIKFNYYITTNPQFASTAEAIRKLIEESGHAVVDTQDSANVVIEIRDPSEQPGSTKYSIGSVTDAVIGDNAQRVGDVKDVANFNMGTQTVQGSINVAMGNARQRIEQSTGLTKDQRSELDRLLNMLTPALQHAEADPEEDDAKVKAVAEEVDKLAEEFEKPTPRWSNIQVRAEGLVQAAKNLAVATPFVLPIAEQILKFVSRFAG
jgi:hypothetical protein